jgi:NitT/TauT family transport system permease protein
MMQQDEASSVRAEVPRLPRRMDRGLSSQPTRLFSQGGPAASFAWWLLGLSLPLLGWETIAALGWVNTLIWPPPHLWLVEAWQQPRLLSLDLWAPRYGAHFVLLSAIFATLRRVVAGVLLGMIAALLVGGLAFSCKPFARLALPLITVLASIAPIGWLPVALVVLGIGDGAAIFVVFICSFCMLTLAVVHAMVHVDPVYVNVARVSGANRAQLLRHVILPGIIPTLLPAVRIVVFMGWITVLTAEVLGVSTGMAAIIAAGRGMMNHPLMYLGIAMASVVGVLLDRTLDLVQSRLLWWKGIARV